jgi:hypothetical protein
MVMRTPGHGEVRLSNVLPLLNGQGLDSQLDLYVFDKQTIREGETLRFEITIPNTRHISNAQAQRRNPGHRGSVRGGQREGHNRTASRMHELPPIKITICWYDPPAPVGSSRALLMHDLDLVVLAPDGALHWGNANKGQDLKSSEDGTKGAQRRAGDPSGANSSFPGWAWADDVNPNEQVYIPNPRCPEHSKEATCLYVAYVHTDYLPVHSSQNFAIITTTSGHVSNPLWGEKWLHDKVPDGSNHPPIPPKIASYLAETVTIKGGLAGGELVSTTKTVDVCGAATLQTLVIELLFGGGMSQFASANNLELTIGKCF